MTFCTYLPANYVHDAGTWPGFIVGTGPDVGVMHPSHILVRSRFLVSSATVPSRVLVMTLGMHVLKFYAADLSL